MQAASRPVLASLAMSTAPCLPSVDPLIALADQCVQCGLCLPVCPTYRHDATESESPRGRIALVRAWSLDALAPTATGDAHLDHCLSCGSCEAVCPAGVKYGALLVGARARQRRRRGTVFRQRAVEWLVARPRTLAGVLGLYRAVYPLLPDRLRPLPPPPSAVSARISTQRNNGATPPAPQGSPAINATGPAIDPASRLADAAATNAEVDLFVGCVAATFERPARAALAGLLAATGVALRIPVGQGCCGAIAAHAGNADGADALARRNADVFRASRTILTLASGCHVSVRATLDASTQVIDALDFLAARASMLQFNPAAGRVALHLPCTQRTQVGSVPTLRRLLARVPQLDLVELDAGFGCCGAAGMQMLDDAPRASSYRAPLLRQLGESGADVLLSANIGCRLHLQNGAGVRVLHPLEFLAAQLQTAR